MIELFRIGFIKVSLIDIIDIILVTWIFYKVYQYFKETRAGQMLIGLIILLIASFLFNTFGISATSWLINQFQTVWVVAFVILFQPEIRRLLIYVGQTRFFRTIFRVGTSRSLESIVEAVALDDKVEIRGFGTFSKKYIRPRKFTNPKTKDVSYLGETATMHFKPSKSLIQK